MKKKAVKFQTPQSSPSLNEINDMDEFIEDISEFTKEQYEFLLKWKPSKYGGIATIQTERHKNYMHSRDKHASKKTEEPS